MVVAIISSAAGLCAKSIISPGRTDTEIYFQTDNRFWSSLEQSRRGGTTNYRIGPHRTTSDRIGPLGTQKMRVNWGSRQA